MLCLTIHYRTTTVVAVLTLLATLFMPAAAETMLARGQQPHIGSGIMGGRTMMPGRCMFTLSHSSMNMAGNRNGNRNLSRAEVHQDFIVAPTSMLTQMNMLGFMCGANNRLTLVGMLPQIRKSMDMQTRNGNRFSMRTSGLGDTRLMAVWELPENKRDDETRKLHVNIGVTLPTGSIDKKDLTPMGRVRLPYPMQLGSGTINPLLGVHYTKLRERWGWGIHTQALFRLGKNSNGYRLGHDYRLNGWFTHRLHANATVSARIAGKVWRRVHGRDSRLNPALVPTARPDLHGGEQADLVLSAQWMHASKLFGKNHFSIVAGVPFYQNLNGPQLKKRYHGKFVWRRML